ncbi:hypothetical protein SETIT_4G071300v2 [Setaria italica]|uniref:Uncharacterized protein n=1 Tax=Setaria italica TaxID=4555 RepID=A0A368QRN2_SETIT|nr:hypothetical protein SETIT_4G071300v2 [Setaria italica]
MVPLLYHNKLYRLISPRLEPRWQRCGSASPESRRTGRGDRAVAPRESPIPHRSLPSVKTRVHPRGTRIIDSFTTDTGPPPVLLPPPSPCYSRSISRARVRRSPPRPPRPPLPEDPAVSTPVPPPNRSGASCSSAGEE